MFKVHNANIGAFIYADEETVKKIIKMAEWTKKNKFLNNHKTVTFSVYTDQAISSLIFFSKLDTKVKVKLTNAKGFYLQTKITMNDLLVMTQKIAKILS